MLGLEAKDLLQTYVPFIVTSAGSKEDAHLLLFHRLLGAFSMGLSWAHPIVLGAAEHIECR